MENRFLRLIDVLARHDVRYIVVGGVAAVLHRVPISTQDFDVVHDRAGDNVEKLLGALRELGAIYRDDPWRLTPGESHLVGPGQQLLQAGNLKLDLLGTIDHGGGYEQLLPESELVEVGPYRVRVLTLTKLIDVKRKLTRPEDKLMLLHLEATLDELKKSGRKEH